MRYHLVIQAPQADLGPFFAHFARRGLQAEISADGMALSWCGLLDWQVSSAELEAWFAEQPSSGLWLVLDPDHVLQGHPRPLSDGPLELTSLAELTAFLAAGLKRDPHILAEQAEALLPLAPSARELLPLLLSAAGLPQVLGSELISAEKPFEFVQPDQEIRALAGKLSLNPLNPPLSLKAETAPLQLFLLAWLGSDQVAPLLILNFDSVVGPPPALDWPTIASSFLERDPAHPQQYALHCEANGTPFGTWGDFADAWAYLWPKLPADTALEIWLAPLAFDREELEQPNPAGIQRYAGVLNGPDFLCQAVAPVEPSVRLGAALDLADWVLNGGDYTLDSAEALRQCCQDAEREMLKPEHGYFFSSPLQICVPDGVRRAFLGRRLFLRQFGDLWDLRESQALMAEIDAEQADLGELFSGWSQPIKGAELLYQGQSGHFWAGRIEGLNGFQQQQLAEATSWWEELGFSALADLVWGPASDVYMRLLFAHSHHSLAVFLLNPYRFETEIISWFGNGARGVSSSVPDLPDFSAEQVFAFDWPEGPLSERIAAHWQQANAYSAREKCPFLVLPETLSGLLPLIDQNLLVVSRAQQQF